MFQSTLKNSFCIDGIGVHSGASCSVEVYPADVNSGIIFSDNERHSVRANYKNVLDTSLRTKLGNSDFSVSTIEHLCSAFYALGVTNANVIVCGGEIPILDGSALLFAENILKVGIEEQSAPRKTLKIKKEVLVNLGNSWGSLTPSDNVLFDVSCDFSRRGLNIPKLLFEFTKEGYVAQIAPARTFGFLEDKEYVRANKLALGTSLDNTLVFDSCGNPINKDGLRLENEPSCHKVLDALGDLSTSEYWIIGAYNSYCPSHKLNHLLLEALFENEENYEIVQQ